MHLLFPVIFLLLSVQRLFSQNTLDNAGLTGSTPASAAYSMRLLSSSYSGYALQVRRSSDNGTQDIGFTAGGDLDTAALKSFVGSGDGYVTAWYDQSGSSEDMTQANTVNQSKLVEAGVINRENGLPFIRFYGVIGTGTYNSLNLPAAMTTVGHVSAVLRFSSDPSGGDGFILSQSGGAYYWHSLAPTYLVNSTYASASVQSGSGWSNGKSYSPDVLPWPATLAIDELEPSAPATNTSWNNIGTDRITAHNISKGGGYSELIVFASALPTTDRQALETNQETYYSIASALPVTWLGFTARVEDAHVLLAWQTATEQDTKSFAVQRNSNESGWKTLATLPAAGNSNGIRHYTYLDTHPGSGNSNYRILLTNLDGKTSYSAINAVTLAADPASFSITSNLVRNGTLQVQVNTPLVLSLYDANGRLLWKKEMKKGMQRISMGNYAKGVYLLGSGRTIAKVLVW